MSEECPRANRWFARCRFEARYDLAAPRALTEPELMEMWPSDVPDTLERIKASTYVRDICIRCGRTVERPSPTHQERAA